MHYYESERVIPAAMVFTHTGSFIPDLCSEHCLAPGSDARGLGLRRRAAEIDPHRQTFWATGGASNPFLKFPSHLEMKQLPFPMAVCLFAPKSIVFFSG